MRQVLIVDDAPTLRELLHELLEEEGYRMTEAAEGNAALELLRYSPHRFVVLLDYLMPGGVASRCYRRYVGMPPSGSASHL